MKPVTSSEFRSNVSTVLDLVENGEVVRILRHGKPIAEIVPFAGEQVTPARKRSGIRIVAPGADLSKAVLAERSGRLTDFGWTRPEKMKGLIVGGLLLASLSAHGQLRASASIALAARLPGRVELPALETSWAYTDQPAERATCCVQIALL